MLVQVVQDGQHLIELVLRREPANVLVNGMWVLAVEGQGLRKRVLLGKDPPRVGFWRRFPAAVLGWSSSSKVCCFGSESPAIAVGEGGGECGCR